MHQSSSIFICIFFISLCSACSSTTPATTPPATTPPPLPILQVSELLFAQTHILPKTGLNWTLTDKNNGKIVNTHFDLIGHRDALAIVTFTQGTVTNPSLEVWFNGAAVSSIALSPPTSLPLTEANGASFRTNSYTGIIPAKWMKVGINLKAKANKYQNSTFLGPINIGHDGDLTIQTLPFYLYGASPGAGGAPTLAQSQTPNIASQQEFFAKWPVSHMQVITHPAGFIQWPYFIIPPRNGGAAYRALSKNDQKDGFASMSAVLKVMGAMRQANGDQNTNQVYYAPLLMWDNTNTYRSPGGGLGGGHLGTGDFSYTGIFIHEMGHAFTLPHQGTAYLQGTYPYIDGSLQGSTWGYDQLKQEFLAPFVPTTASRFANCQTNPVGRPLDGQGQCVKRDPMWGGDGDQAAGYQFATFSDFSTAQIQQDIGKQIYIDPYSTTGFSQWDTTSKQRIDVTLTTTNKGIYGLDKQLPTRIGIPVYTIVITFSHTPCLTTNPSSVCNAAGVDTTISQIYPPIPYTGNLRRVIDPSNPADLASIVPDTSVNPWYCRNGGCDYTVRVTFTDASTWHGLIQGGFRPWNQARGTPTATTQDPLSNTSFKTWAINIPAAKTIAKIDLLYTPMVWNGLPVNPTVLLTR